MFVKENPHRKKQKNIGETLISGRHLFQCYPKVRRLFEARRLLEEIRYLWIIIELLFKYEFKDKALQSIMYEAK